jgi:hypothetical protein
MNKHRGMEVQLHIFITSALDGDEWSDSRFGYFIPEKEFPDTH